MLRSRAWVCFQGWFRPPGLLLSACGLLAPLLVVPLAAGGTAGAEPDRTVAGRAVHRALPAGLGQGDVDQPLAGPDDSNGLRFTKPVWSPGGLLLAL